MRNMAVLHSPAFSYPLPVLVRVLFNLLIFKGKILYYNKYTEYHRNNRIKHLRVYKFLNLQFYSFIHFRRKTHSMCKQNPDEPNKRLKTGFCLLYDILLP